MLTPIDDMGPEMAQVAKGALAMRATNVRLIGEIEQMGGAVEVHVAMFEHFKEALVRLGVITEQQMWEVALDWEKYLRQQLKAVHLNMVNQIRAAQGPLVAQKKLWKPGDPS